MQILESNKISPLMEIRFKQIIKYTWKFAKKQSEMFIISWDFCFCHSSHQLIQIFGTYLLLRGSLLFVYASED